MENTEENNIEQQTTDVSAEQEAIVDKKKKKKAEVNLVQSIDTMPVVAVASDNILTQAEKMRLYNEEGFIPNMQRMIPDNRVIKIFKDGVKIFEGYKSEITIADRLIIKHQSYDWRGVKVQS